MRKPPGFWSKSAQDLAVCYTEEDTHSKGYIQISVNGRVKQLHRHIWEQLVGPIPDGYQIDHINGIRHDNRLDNLRCVPVKTNNRNQKIHKRNPSGVTGVTKEVNGKYSYWAARWTDPVTGKEKRKTFSITKHGEAIAKQLAIAYREEILKELINNHGYTCRHGR